MAKFWKKGEQAQQSKVVATPASSSSSELQTVEPVRKPACWGASKASGEPEVVCAPSTDKIKAVRQDCSPGPPSPDTSKGSAHSWNPFAKNKAPLAAGANAMQQQAAAPARGTYFSSFPILGGRPSAATSKQANTTEEKQVSTGDQISNFAGQMGNVVVRSMAGGFGWTLGSRAARSLWTGRR